MSHLSIWIVIIALSLFTIALRGSFILALGARELPESFQRYLRYVSVAIIPGMIAVLVVFPASTGGVTNIAWLGATISAIVAGIRFKNPLIIMLVGALAFLVLSTLV